VSKTRQDVNHNFTKLHNSGQELRDTAHKGRSPLHCLSDELLTAFLSARKRCDTAKKDGSSSKANHSLAGEEYSGRNNQHRQRAACIWNVICAVEDDRLDVGRPVNGGKLVASFDALLPRNAIDMINSAHAL